MLGKDAVADRMRVAISNLRKDHINKKILHSGSKAHCNGNTRNPLHAMISGIPLLLGITTRMYDAGFLSPCGLLGL